MTEAANHNLTAFRDAFIGDDADKEGLGSKGWLFFAKDSGAVYFHSGSQWKELPIDSPLTDTDDDGLLEAPDHNGIDIDADGAALNLDTASGGQNARLRWKEGGSNRFSLRYSPSNDHLDLYDFSRDASVFRVNEGGPVEINTMLNSENIRMNGANHNPYVDFYDGTDDSRDWQLRNWTDGGISV